MNKKSAAVLLAVLLVVGIAIGGTMAWLSDETDDIINTFTVGNINIELTETWNTDTDNDGKNETWKCQMIPGVDVVKDPTVTVKANSEDCWLFVRVNASSNLANYIKYEIISTENEEKAWTALTEVPDVYYREVAASDKDQSFDVIGYTDDNNVFYKNKVLVKDTVTKAMMDELEKPPSNYPTLTFTAYAVQKDKNGTEQFTASEAWQKVSASA